MFVEVAVIPINLLAPVQTYFMWVISTLNAKTTELSYREA